MLKKALFFLFCICYFADAQYEGDPCIRNTSGLPGKCRVIQKCQTAIEEFRKKILPQICSFFGADPVVCCVEAQATTTKAPVLTTTQRINMPVTDDIPVYDYKENGVSVGNCAPIDPSLTSAPTQSKAWNKCLEYQQSLVYPCSSGVDLAGAASRATQCHHSTDELIIGGENAAEFEFPHMVLLGFGDPLDSVQWACAGSLISEKFVLTAGHCTVSRDQGPVTYALPGVLRRSEPMDPSRLRRIRRIIPYPQYAPPNRYHDIALLELDSPVTLSQFLVPACLRVPDDVTPEDRASATGWGLTTNRGNVSDVLQKVILHQFQTQECKERYLPNRHVKQGFDPNTQICYGDHQNSKDTCQGDSGGPLQIKSTKINCMYMVIGVTSFGKECGHIGEPGVYTRVEHYVPWIESVVWP